MGKQPVGWVNALRARRVNIWEPKYMRPDKWLCNHPYTEVKFTRPPWLTRYGFPAQPRTAPGDVVRNSAKHCDMSKLHKQDAKKPFGVGNETIEGR
mmetsp:Transcript_63740/g.137093  ORF Transcript_63740/g.137093 Transcript_63740/m.137093 type:complete len:96 (+) Transcript_63740:91-378(+)|eukprot:CAMPEP_0180471328 /NCGR_PEP_ID=MMETSP1036_2-20121128/29059_1 /TAXON_ID=632150 /ORGANISM="Azadinium spinosum, Strain 3D9" /LENGTH=95 /DNA_ID=CAMNT_0022478519 /DNA_START=90 /DNA_END=377 /DNA_ORIENTATION=+